MSPEGNTNQFRKPHRCHEITPKAMAVKEAELVYVLDCAPRAGLEGWVYPGV